MTKTEKQIPWDSPELAKVGPALVRKVKQWRQVGDPPSHELTGLGDDDEPATWRSTYVSRHDLPHLGDWEIPMAVVERLGLGGGDGPNNGAAAQIIWQAPLTIASVHLGGFVTCQPVPRLGGMEYERWQRWIQKPAPGYRWCAHCDRTLHYTHLRPACEECWPMWREHPKYIQFYEAETAKNEPLTLGF